MVVWDKKLSVAVVVWKKPFFCFTHETLKLKCNYDACWSYIVTNHNTNYHLGIGTWILFINLKDHMESI